jgi:hypothetical protein
MNKESLAKAILQGLKAQVGILYLHDEGDLEEMWLDGPVDLRQLADSLLDYLSPKSEQPLSVTGIESHSSSPIIKITWGDGVVTYAHFTQEAEIIHKLARDGTTKRIGSIRPEEAMAS